MKMMMTKMMMTMMMMMKMMMDRGRDGERRQAELSGGGGGLAAPLRAPVNLSQDPLYHHDRQPGPR